LATILESYYAMNNTHNMQNRHHSYPIIKQLFV